MRRVYAAFFFGALALPIGSACSTGVEAPDPSGLRVDDDVIAISGRDASMPGALAESDCSLDATTPGPRWEPQTVLPIAVVVHVIADDACATGNVSDELIAGQIAALNEDFRALAGTPGEAGADTRVEFFLATKDPQGAPSTGVTRSCNTNWHQDKGDYWLSLAWDPTRYLNLYTNNASGARGYVPFLPADPAGAVGEPADRVVINWLAFGRPGPFPPYHLGRTVTHEVGHFLGLFHTYYEGCGLAEAPNCYTTGDRLCDTPPNVDSHKGCPTDAVACGGVPAPVHNYMELTDDACLTGFTAEQAQRVRCTLGTYRPGLLLRELGGKVPLSR